MLEVEPYCDMQNKWFEHVTFVMNVGQSECPLSTIEIGVESLPGVASVK